MKKNPELRIKTLLSKIINFRLWLDLDRLQSLTLSLIDGLMRLFVPLKKDKIESFNAVTKRMHLTKEDLQKQQEGLYRLSLIMLFSALLLFIYMGYQLFYGSYQAAIVSFFILWIALVLAFRYHFWYFQIKNRKLGCTVYEWYRGLLGDKNE
jgi:intracellular multiplication protein IcmV